MARRRFRRLVLTVVVLAGVPAGVLAAVWLLAAIGRPRLSWHGVAARDICAVITDAAGRPVAGAVVTLVYAHEEGPLVIHSGNAGADGVWCCRWAFAASGDSVLLWDTGRWGVCGYSLSVTAPGYRAFTGVLTELGGRRTIPLSEAGLAVCALLERE